MQVLWGARPCQLFNFFLLTQTNSSLTKTQILILLYAQMKSISFIHD